MDRGGQKRHATITGKMIQAPLGRVWILIRRLAKIGFALISLSGLFLLVACSDVTLENWSEGTSYYCTSFLELDGGTMLALRSRDGLHFFTVGSFTDPRLSDPFSINIQNGWWLVYSESYNHLYPVLTFGIAKSLDGGNTYSWQQDYAPSIGNNCYEVGTPKFVTNADGTPFSDAEGYHLFFECFAEQSFAHIAFYEIHSTDLAHWSSPAAKVNTAGFPQSVQNPVVIAKNGTFYLWYKNEAQWTIEYAQASSLLGPYVPVERGDWAGWGPTWDSEWLVRTGPSQWIIYLMNPMSYSKSDDDWRTWSRPRRVDPDGLRNGDVMLVNPQ